MEVFPSDDPPPNDVGSGPTVSQPDPDWDESFASLEIALQAVCETKDTHLDTSKTEGKDVTDQNEVKTEVKRKWEDDDSFEDFNKPKLKRVNNMLLGSGEVTIQLVGQTNESCDKIPISDILSIMKSEPKPKLEEFDIPTDTIVKKEIEFIKLEPKQENSDFKNEIVECKPELSENKDLNLKEETFPTDAKFLFADSKIVLPRDVKSDSGFTDDLSMESKVGFFSPEENMLCYDLKGTDEKPHFKPEINSEPTLSANESEVSPNANLGCPTLEVKVENTLPDDNLSNLEESCDRKRERNEEGDISTKKDDSDKSSKKDDKLLKKKKFERCNIRDIKLDDELDAVTLSAQKEEQERIQRLQEAQMRALQERLQQIEVEKEALSQLFSQPNDDAQNLFDSSMSEPETSDECKVPIKTEKDVVLVESSDEDKKAKLQNLIPSPIEENIIDISSSSSGNDSDSEDSDKKDDDVMVLSDEGEPEGEGTAEDPNNSGAHTNDCFNLPDEEGRVLVNVGHPPEDPDIFLAPQIAKVIKPHQIGGIRFLYDNVVENLERYKSSSGFGCILAHSMGLGKTVQVVSFVDVFLRHTPATLVLCIVPINTIQNWKAEFDMWVPPSNCVEDAQVLNGEVRPRDCNIYTLNENFKTMATRAGLIAEWRKEGGVLLMGYEMYRMLALRKMPKIPLKKSKRLKKQEMAIEPETNEQIKKYMDEMYEHIVIPGPDLVICDEGHRIKNSLASTSMALKSIKTRRRVVLTGYPLQNNLLEYWCMVDFVRPNYLGSRAEFCNMFERPISNGQCIDSTPRDRQLMRFRSHVLHSLLVGFVQRRGHSVLRAVLPKKEEHVLLIRMTPIQRQLYKCFVKDLLYVQQATNPLKLFAVCCKIWNHPDILYKLLQEKKAQEDIDLDIDINIASSATSTCGKKKGIGQKSKLLQRPLRALPRNLKPQTCSSEEVKSEASCELENITASEDANFNSSDICKDEFSTSNQVGLSVQKDYSQTYPNQYSSNNSSQQFCQQNYQISSGQQYNSSAHYLPQSNMNQTHFSSQASPQPVTQQYSQPSLMQQQYGQSQNQYPQGSTQAFSQVHSPFGSQTKLQQENIPSSKSSFQGKSPQSYSSPANALQYSSQADVQKQYQQNMPQTQFKNPSSNSQEAHFSPPSNPKFTPQSTPQYPHSPASHQSYSPQSSKYSQQPYPPTSKQYSEQQFTSQTDSRPSSQFVSPQSYAQISNPQSHASEQTSTHNFSSQSTLQMSPPQSQFSQSTPSQPFSQQSVPLASSQFSSQGSFSQMSQSEHFPPQTSAQQPSSTQTFSQSSPNQQVYSQTFSQQSSEFSQPSPSTQQFQKQSMQPFSQHTSTQPSFNSAHQSFPEATQIYPQQSSPLQQKFPQQATSQPFLSHEQQYSEQSSKQFSQNSEQSNFSPSQSFTHQSLQPTKFDNNQGLSFSQQTSGGKGPFPQSSSQATQKPVSQSPPQESSQQQNFTPTFSSDTSGDSQFSQQAGPFCHQSSQSFSQQSNQLTPSFNTSQKVQQYIQSASNTSQYNQSTTKSEQSYNQPTSEQFSQSENQTAQQYNSQPQSSQYSQQINQSSQYSQHATSQQFPQQSSKPQFGQTTQNQMFSQHTNSQFSHNTQNHKYPQHLPQTASSMKNIQQFNQPSQYPQPPQLSQQYSTQAPQSQQYAQSSSQSPQQFLQDQSTQQYAQQPVASPLQSGHFSSSNTQQRFSQPATQSSPDFNQQPIQSSTFSQQQPQQSESFNQPSQQYNQPPNHPSQQYNHISGQNSQFNQQGNQCQQFSPQSNASTQLYNQQLNSNSVYKQQLQTSQQYDVQASQPPQYNQNSQSNQQYDQISSQSTSYASKPIQTPQPYSQQSSQQYSHQQQCQPSQYGQQPPQSPQQFSQPVPSPQYVQQPLQSPQQFSQSGQSPQQFTQSGQSPQQFNQSGQSPQQFNQSGQSPQQFTQPVQSPQQFSHQTTPSPQQFIQQPSVSPQQFSQQNIQSSQEFVQSSQQYPQPPQQQYKQQTLPPGQSSQFSLPQQCLTNVASQQFSNSFPQTSNQDSAQGTFQSEYQSQIQSNLSVLSQQGLSPQSMNQQTSKPNAKGTKPKQGRSKLCQNLLPQNAAQHSQASLKQPPSFSVQGFQNGSPPSNVSQRPLGQHAIKQGSGTTFQPLNSPVSHQDNFSLQPIKQDASGTFPAKCSKAVLQGPQQINNPDTSSVQQLAQNTMKPESVSLESDPQSNTCTDATVMPFRDRMDSSISYEWAIPIMKEYVLGVLENSHKMMVLFVIIAETLHMGDKLLVFSQSLSTLDLLEHFLGKIQVPKKPDHPEQFSNETWCRNKNYFRLDGSTSAQEREKLINEFNRNDSVSLFLLSTRAGCLGINLVGANRIVVMDASWNPCHDAQAVCRIYRYGQKKQCHIYRLVTDNSLEKRIYDRQVNKQGMSDRVVDELNPESNFTWKDVTTLIQDDEDDGPIQELSKFASSYSDKVLKYLVQEMSPSLSKEPFEHESLLLDRKDLKLTKQEKRLAKQSYEMAKRANMINIRTTYTYLPAGTAGGGQIIINNKQCQWVGGTTIRVLPNQSTSSGGNARPGSTATPITASPSLMSSLFKQGVMVQKLTMPSNVSIPVLTPGAPPVVIPAGQDVLVLRTPKGVYLRLPDGRIIAVQLPPSLLAKTQFRPNVVTHFRPATPKGGNQPSTVINTPRGQSIGIIKQTLQCGGTVRYLGPRGASGSTNQNSARSSAPEVIDLSDDDEPLIRKSASASNASTNSSESDSGSMDQDKFENNSQPTMLPGKQITIRKISPNSPQNLISLSNSKEKCEIPQVLSKNKQITIMPINPTNQQSRQKFAPQLAQPVRVQQMLLQPQQGKKRPFQKSTQKVQMMPAISGKSMRPQVTVTQPTNVQSLKSSQTSIQQQQKNSDHVENISELRNNSPTKHSEDSPTVSSDRDPTLNVVSPLQSVPQILQNSKSISISLSEPSKTNAVTLPDSLASLANKLNPNLQISPVEQPAVSDLLQPKNAFHFNSSIQAVSSSSLQNQITHTVQTSLLSNKTELPTPQSTYTLKSSTSESQSSFSISQVSSLPSSISNKIVNSDQSFQYPGSLQANLHQMQQKSLSEQQSVEYTSQTSTSQNSQLTISPLQPQATSQDQQMGSRKKKSTNKLASKKSEHSLISQNHPLQSQVQETPQFSHPQISEHHPPENQFTNFSRISSSDFPAFTNFASPKPASHIQHPQPLHPLQHSQEHALPPHLQHMSRMYPHLTGNPSLTDMQPMAPRAWPVPQPTVSSFHPFSQSSSFYSSGQDGQFSFQPNSLPLPSSNSKQSEPNINSGSEGDKASHFNLSNL